MNQSSVHTKPATPPTHRDRFFLIRSPEFLFVYFSFFFFFFDATDLRFVKSCVYSCGRGLNFKQLPLQGISCKSRADLGGGCRGCPPHPPDDLRLSNTTGIPQNMQICMIYLYSQQFTFSSHYVIAKSKAFVEIAFKICLRHQSVLLFLNGAPPLKKTCIHPLTSVFK